MKRNLIPTNKLALLSAAVCALMLAFSHNASATPGPLPISVPDAWFGATLPVEVTLAFKLGLKWSFKRTATFTSYARHRGVTADCKGHELNGD